MNVQETLHNIIELFQMGQIPEAVAFATFPSCDVPCSHWSFANRLLCFFHHTEDARGYRQWQAVNRQVKKGAKAFHIIAPRLGKKKKNPPVNPEEQEAGISPETITSLWFVTVPVFCEADTEGEPLDYQQIILPDLPLMDRAIEWGLNVRAVPGNKMFYGRYGNREIALATSEEKVFFHELSHHAHSLVIGELKPGQDWRQEIVAELSAQALCRIIGKHADSTLGNSYRYIAHYAKEAGMNPVHACLQVIGDVEAVLRLILKQEPEENRIKAVAM